MALHCPMLCSMRHGDALCSLASCQSWQREQLLEKGCWALRRRLQSIYSGCILRSCFRQSTASLCRQAAWRRSFQEVPLAQTSPQHSVLTTRVLQLVAPAGHTRQTPCHRAPSASSMGCARFFVHAQCQSFARYGVFSCDVDSFIVTPPMHPSKLSLLHPCNLCSSTACLAQSAGDAVGICCKRPQLRAEAPLTPPSWQ